MMDHQDTEEEEEEEEEEERNRTRSTKRSTNIFRSVWLFEAEDLRARLPVLFEGTKYEERERATTPERGALSSRMLVGLFVCFSRSDE